MTTTATTETAPTEELEFNADKRRVEATRAITVTAMARRLPQIVARAYALTWRIEPRSAALLLTCQILSAALGAGGLFATANGISAVFAGGATTARLTAALPSILVIAATTGLRRLLGIVNQAITVRLSPRIALEAEATVLRATLGTELTAYDHSGYSDDLEAADRGAEQCAEILGEAQNLLASIGSLIGAASVIAYLHPLLLPLLVLAALPQGLASVRAARVQYLASRDTMADRRVMANLRWYIHVKAQADQIRSDTMSSFLLAKYNQVGQRLDRTAREAATATAKVSIIGALASGLGAAIVWATMAWLVISGRMSLPHGGAAVVVLTAVSNSLAGIVGYGAYLFRIGMYLDDYFHFLDSAGGFALRTGTHRPEPPRQVAVKELTYQYPASERTALDGVTLHVNRGEIVALVGENGSGKTTLAKCLAGLYTPEPGNGAVEWDGTDTRSMDPQSMWQQVAVVPQNYAKWPMSARENITLGQPHDEGDDEALWAAARASGADEVLADLRSGLGTLLAVEWLGGEELSGGQWQRIALARAFYRRAGLLVMDEPTAALDPRAEHLIFTNLREVAADRAVVLVTHRLTNVAIADRIVVLDHGRIIQAGTFDELVADIGGRFRELWDLQNDRTGIPVQRDGDGTGTATKR
ncbi:ABC transporter ATP-binding protein [Kitasatospora sp. NPDC094011]|uniref:ABC transporter ATP-binding protein n=1 Tax=Kitasatospora sp. NPDC094011 TaxID=3364090 RepID=UPI00381C5337